MFRDQAWGKQMLSRHSLGEMEGLRTSARFPIRFRLGLRRWEDCIHIERSGTVSKLGSPGLKYLLNGL